MPPVGSSDSSNIGDVDAADAASLVAAVGELARADSVGEVHSLLRRHSRRLTGAEGSSLILLVDHSCYYAEEDGINPGWKGRRIPIEDSVAGRAMRRGGPVMVPEVREDLDLTVAPYWSTPVASLLVVPIGTGAPMGALANYWSRPHHPADSEVTTLQALADSAALALRNVVLRSEIDLRVKERTAELEELNSRLELEVADRRKAEDEVRQMSLADELTGLYNRRGFTLLARRELKAAQRNGRRALVIYVDLDGLKQANDTYGHEAGDRLIVRAASVLRAVSRQTDIAARMGGDEFAVFATFGYDEPPVHLIVERYLQTARNAGLNWSIGATPTVPDRASSLEDLLLAADEAMYRGRRARRGSPATSTGR